MLSAMDARTDQINFGFGIAVLFVTAWANIQWRRFMRFWLKPPYRPLTTVVFRLFFAAGLLGATWDLANEIPPRGAATFNYVSGLKTGLAMCVASWCLFSVVSWLTRKRDLKDQGDSSVKP